MLQGSYCGTTCGGGKGNQILLNSQLTLTFREKKNNTREEFVFFLECSLG